jgi:hypothetical protein
MATLCHFFSKEILVRFKFSSLPPFVFWSPSDKISTLNYTAVYAGCFACLKTSETAVFVSPKDHKALGIAEHKFDH